MKPVSSISLRICSYFFSNSDFFETLKIISEIDNSLKFFFGLFKISDLILKGDVHEIKAIMAKSNELGMKTFDQALFDLYEADKITYEDALRSADSMNELRLRIKLEGKAAKGSDSKAGLEHISLHDDEEEEEGKVR